jgi:hypothetical protein
MSERIKLLGGLGASVLANAVWVTWPEHESFRLKVLKATSLAEPEKSPLAFVEHYHWGLASLVLARYAGRYSGFFDGFGVGMVAIEASSDKPFGFGKTPWEVRGNLILGGLLSGLLIVSLAK